MEAINKNKEEIEKLKIATAGIEGVYRDGQLKATIKTSILWCEAWSNWIDTLEDITMSCSDLKQLQTHLTYLKEQEKKQ